MDDSPAQLGLEISRQESVHAEPLAKLLNAVILQSGYTKPRRWVRLVCLVIHKLGCLRGDLGFPEGTVV